MRNASLRTQLLVSHLLPVGLMLLALVGAVAGFFQLGRSVDRILKDNYKSVVAAQDMKESLERIDSAATFYLAGQKGWARQQYAEYRPRFLSAYQIEASNITEKGEGQTTRDIGRSFADYDTNIRRLLLASPELSTADARALYFQTLEPSFVHLKQRAQDVLDLNQAAIARADARTKSEAQRDAVVGVIATAGAGLLAAGLAWRLIGAIMTPLVTLTRQSEEIGAGRLNQRIDARGRTDEIGQLARTFNTMAERLAEARETEAERLHRAERMSDAALENLYDPVVVTDAQGRVVHLNRAAEGLFGPDARARGQAAGEVVREKRLVGAIERAIGKAEASAEEGEAALISFSGREGSEEMRRTYRLRVNPMHDGDEGGAGALLGAVAVLEDVTHLTELDRLKTEFIGVASHELRTPVTSMLLGVQLLQEGAIGPLTEVQQEVIDATREDLKRLERMMRDLLDLTRLEAGATPPRFEVISPGDLVRSAAESLTAAAKAKGVSLTVEAPRDLPVVRADRAQIGRVLVNLLSNAVRHTPKGGSVRACAEGRNPQVSGVRFVISDTGSGIPREYREHIFERFTQVPGATRGGAGLGLSISQAIVRAHGGEITVESEIGQGSTFTFVVPTVSKNSGQI